MATEETTIKDGYAYIDEMDYDPSEDGVVAPAEFASLIIGHPNTQMVDNVIADKTKYCASGFPTQNLDTFTFIPLYVNAGRKVMYFQPYGGEAVPPDCYSMDGQKPHAPLLYNGMEINNCSICPLFGFGKEYKCHTKPAMVGLAYFPEHGDLLVPIRKDIPAKSIKAFNGMVRQLSAPVKRGEEFKAVPYWMRLVNLGVLLQQSPYGLIPTFTFSVLPDQFVPQHLAAEIQKFVGVAKTYARAEAGPPQLTGGAPMAQLTGGPAPDTASEPSIVSAEEVSNY